MRGAERGRAATLVLFMLVLAGFMTWAVLAEAIPLTEGRVFKVQEGSVPGTPANLLTANALEFSYNSAVTQPTVPGPFTEVGAASIGGFSLTGTHVPSFLGAAGPTGYGMYATWTASGSSIFKAVDELEDNYTSFAISVFIDPNQSVVINPNGTISGLSGDEYLIGTGSLAAAARCAPNPTCGQDHVFLPPNLAKGDFHFLLDWSLTAAGLAYFVDPANPFYPFADFAGVVSTIQFPGCNQNTGICTNFNSTEQGSGDAFFPVPEPASLLLLATGLLLVGRYARRRKA